MTGFAAPPSLGTLSTSIKTELDTMVGHSGDACDLFGTMGSAFGSAAKAIADAAEKATAAVLKGLASIAKTMKEFTDKISGLISKAMSKIKNLAASAITAINNAINKIGTALANVAKSVKAAISNVVKAIGDGLTNLKKKLADALSSAFSAFNCGAVKDSAAGLGTGLSPEMDKVTNAMSAGGIEPSADLLTAGNSIKAAASNALPGINSFANTLSSSVGSSISDLDKLLA